MGLVFTTKKNRYYYTFAIVTYWKWLGYFGEAIINPFAYICASIKLVKSNSGSYLCIMQIEKKFFLTLI